VAQPEFFARFPLVPVGTSKPVTLLDGLELLPGVKPARAGIQVSDSFTRILYQAGTFLFARTKVAVDYKLLLGVAGPSIAFLFDPVDVTARNQGGQGKVDLDFSSSQEITAQSGVMAGVGFTANIHIVQELYLPSSWYSPWRFKWTSVLDKQLTFNVDLLQLLVWLITYLIGRGSASGTQRGAMQKDTGDTLKKILNGQTTWRLFDAVNGGFPASRTLSPAPRITIPWNMVDYVPLLAQFAKFLQALKGDLFLGPTLSIQFPTTLRLDRLTVENGQGAGTSADYGQLDYSSTKVIGSGKAFTPGATPSRLTTHVNYETRLGVLLSCVFQVSVAKIFSIGVNTPSLDLLRLLRLPRPSLGAINNTVSSTLPSPPVVLVPQLALSVTNQSLEPWPIFAGIASPVTVRLRNPWPGPGALTVNLTNDQNLPGFPSQLTIPVGQSSADTRYVFPSRGVATGNPDQPDETESASPSAPEYTVRITAQGSPAQIGDRPDFESIQAIRIENPIMSIDSTILAPFQQADGPVWAPLNGQYMNPGNRSSPNVQPPGFNVAIFRVTWNGAIPRGPVPVRFTLLDEEREPWTVSSVRVTVPGATSGFQLRPSVTVEVPANAFAHWSFTITWDSIGQPNGFSNRFIVVVDAGVDYGQDEVWLYVSNWS
jgi:hypothetical protein